MRARVLSEKTLDNDLLKAINSSEKFKVVEVYYKETHHNLQATYPMPTMDVQYKPKSVKVVFVEENIVETISLWANPTIKRYLSGEFNYKEYKSEEERLESQGWIFSICFWAAVFIVLLIVFSGC